MSAADRADAPSAAPTLRIVGGNPSDEEIAVLVTVFAAAGGGSGNGGGHRPPARNDWGRPIDMFRPNWGTPTSFINLRPQPVPNTGTSVQVVLGSASPARLDVLRNAGLDPRVLVSGVDEEALLSELVGAPPTDAVVRLAEAKGDAIVARLLSEDSAESPDILVLTCDSMLLLDGELSGKPHTPEAATAQWKRVRGQSAQLLTGHCATLISGREVVASARETASVAIDFAYASDAEIDAYVATGEPLEVAGAFTLDRRGGWFVERIDGDPSAVIGIGLPTVRRLATRLGLSVPDLWSD